MTYEWIMIFERRNFLLTFCKLKTWLLLLLYNYKTSNKREMEKL